MLKFATVNTFGKSDTFKFNPLDLISRFSTFTGRKVRTVEAISKMADSLLLHGQEQDFIYRKGHDGDPVPVTGHTRILAAAKITSEKMTGSNGVQYSPENPFVVRGAFRAMNELEAVIHTFVENDDETRTPLNDLDVAFMIRVLDENFGLTDGEIATKLGKQASFISTHRALLEADPATQAKVANGELNFSQAQAVLKVEPAKREEVLAKTAKKGKVTAAAISATAAEVGATVKGKVTPRSLKALKDAIKPIADGPTSPAKYRALALYDFLVGRGTEADLIAALGEGKKASA